MEVTSSLYEKLKEGSLEIRLLEIIPSVEEHEMLKLQLHTVSLKDDPKYTALSYVWGDPAVTESVILNGEDITIGANLASAMCHLRTFQISPEEKYRGEQDMLRFEGTLFHQSTDPRDKIYSLIGLMELDMTADYAASVTVRDFYSQFVEKYLAAGQVSEWLTFSRIGWNLDNPYNLPS